MKDKWKAFGVNETLSSWDSGLSAAELFDVIDEADSTELDDVFAEHGIEVWEPFEHFDTSEVATQIQDLARRAQEVSDQE